MKVKNTVFNIGNEFKFKWLFMLGFWKLIKCGIMAYGGHTSYTESLGGDMIVGTPTIKHRRDLRIKGYTVNPLGYVFGAKIYVVVKRK